MHPKLIELHSELLENNPELVRSRENYKVLNKALRVLFLLGLIILIHVIFSGNKWIAFAGVIILILIVYVELYLKSRTLNPSRVVQVAVDENMHRVMECFPNNKLTYNKAPKDIDFLWGLGLFNSPEKLKRFAVVTNLVTGDNEGSKYKIVNIDFKQTGDKAFVNLGWRKSTLLSMDYKPIASGGVLFVQNALLLISNSSAHRRLNELKKIINIDSGKKKKAIENQELKKRFTGFAASEEDWEKYYDEDLVARVIAIDKRLANYLKFISIKNGTLAILLFSKDFVRLNANSSNKDWNPFYDVFLDIEKLVSVAEIK